MLPLGHVQSLGEALLDATYTFKSNVALLEADRRRETGRRTFAEVRAEAVQVAEWLQAGGFVAGDRCAILMQNGSRWPIGATGVFIAGGVLLPLDYKLTAPEQAALIAHGRPSVLLTEWPVWRLLRDHIAGLEHRPRVVVHDVPEGEALDAVDGLEVVRWDDLPAPVDVEGFALVERAREDVACIVYSSGTGGTPKGCMLTHDNYLCQAEALGAWYPMAEDDLVFSVLPTNHAIDFMTGFLMPALFGGRVVHQRTLRGEFLSWTMQHYGVTHIALVPRLLKMFEEKIRERIDGLPAWQRLVVDGLLAVNEAATWKRPNHALSSKLLKPLHDGFGGRLRYIFAGGAFVERDMAEFFHRIGIPVAIGYGLTEAGTVLTLNDLAPFRADTVGRPIDGVELELRDVDADGVGEVWVRGGTVMKGYLDEPELTAETIVDGWLRTGDRGRLDASGHLKLLGRAKNMIVTAGGKNVYPEDVEALIGDLPGCEELCVVATDYVWPGRGGLGAETLAAVVYLGDDGDLDTVLGELARRNRTLADYKRLAFVVVADDAFPRTASMKVKRGVLAEQVRAQGEPTDLLRALDAREAAE